MNLKILRLLPLLLLMGLALASTTSCGHGSKQQQDTTAWDYKAPPAMPVNRALLGDSMGLIAEADIHRLPTYIEQRPLKEIFNDSNALQLEAAEKNGFQPVTSLRDAYRIDKPLIRIFSCDAYMLDDLSASVPTSFPKPPNCLRKSAMLSRTASRSAAAKPTASRSPASHARSIACPNSCAATVPRPRTPATATAPPSTSVG